MNKTLLLFLLAILLTVNSAGFAQSLPERIVEITRKDVNVRKAAATNAAVLKKAPLGKQYELVAEKDAWFEIKDPITGDTGFVSKSVSTSGKPVDVTSFLNSNPNSDYQCLIDETATKGYEQSYTYTFGLQENDKQRVSSWLTDQYANMQGQVRTNQAMYKGKNSGWYIVLDKEINAMDEETEKGDITPLVFYISLSKKGMYCDGMLFKPVAQTPY